MNWSFRSSPQSLCDTIEPLLSVYADGMASPAEAGQVDAHLPQCKACRAALSWMQATRTTLASRPIVFPPPDLHSRIALAIAASSPAPTSLRPARVFTRRTTYAAAASVTVLGAVLSYGLLHTPNQVKPAPPVVAVVPGRSVKTYFTPKTTRPLVASSSAKPAARHSLTARKPVLVAPLPEHIAAVTPPAKRLVVPQVVKAPVHSAPPIQKIASANLASNEKHYIEKHAPLPTRKIVTPKLPDTVKVAKTIKEPSSITLDIHAPRVTADAPPVQVASTHQAVMPDADFGMGKLRASLRIQNAVHAPVGLSKADIVRDAANVARTVENDDHTAFISAVHGNQ